MPFIELIEVEDAQGPLKRIYDAAEARAGYVANIIKSMSQHPASCQASMQLYSSLMKTENGLDAPTREFLATIVSNFNDCHY